MSANRPAMCLQLYFLQEMPRWSLVAQFVVISPFLARFACQLFQIPFLLTRCIHFPDSLIRHISVKGVLQCSGQVPGARTAEEPGSLATAFGRLLVGP